MSERAQKIETARRLYVAALGSPSEANARDALEIEVAAARDEASRDRTQADYLLHVVDVTDGLLLAINPDPASRAASSTTAEPLTLHDFVSSREIVNMLAESNNQTLTTALWHRGLKFSAELIQELAQELARNAAQIVLATEVKP